MISFCSPPLSTMFFNESCFLTSCGFTTVRHYFLVVIFQGELLSATMWTFFWHRFEGQRLYPLSSPFHQYTMDWTTQIFTDVSTEWSFHPPPFYISFLVFAVIWWVF